MFPLQEKANVVSNDIMFVWLANGLADQLIYEMAQCTRKAKASVYAINRLPTATLKKFGLDYFSNGLFIHHDEIPNGLWINVYARLPGVADRLKQDGKTQVEAYPIIYPVSTNAETGEQSFMVISLPRQIMLSGDRLYGARVDRQSEILIEGKIAAVILAEILTRYHGDLNFLLRNSHDITHRDVRQEIADDRGESVTQFEQKLAGKSFICAHESGRILIHHTRDGRQY